MRRLLKILLVSVISVCLASCGKASKTASSEAESPKNASSDVALSDAASSKTVSSELALSLLDIFETPEIVFVRVDDNTKRIREGSFDGPAHVYYLFSKDGYVYRLDDPVLSLEQLTQKCADGSITADMAAYLIIDDKEGLQKCFDKFQIVLNNKGFHLSEPDFGPDWSHKDTTWYGLYYDEEDNLQMKKIYFIGDLERRYVASDKNADDIINWLETYVSNYLD